MTFRPIFDQRYVEDHASGARLRIHSTKEIDTLWVEVEGLYETTLKFAMWLQPTQDGLASKLKISAGDLEQMFRRANLADHEANTIIVGKIIEGISAFNKVWSQATTPILTSNRDDALAKGHPLPFSIPSDDELTAISRKIAGSVRSRRMPEIDTSAINRIVRRRQSEVYSADRKKRLVVMRRDDGHFQLIEESIRSYEDGDEYNPTIVPFPKDGDLGEWWIIHRTLLDGIFGSAADAEAEARRLLRLT